MQPKHDIGLLFKDIIFAKNFQNRKVWSHWTQASLATTTTFRPKINKFVYFWNPPNGIMNLAFQKRLVVNMKAAMPRSGVGIFFDFLLVYKLPLIFQVRYLMVVLIVITTHLHSARVGGKQEELFLKKWANPGLFSVYFRIFNVVNLNSNLN